MTTFLIAHRYAVLLLVAVFCGVLGWNARHFEVDASADTLLTRDNEKFIQSKAVSERFSPEEFLLVSYEPIDRPLLSQQTFDDLRAIGTEIGKLPRVDTVRSILNVPLLTMAGGASFSSIKADDLTVEKAGYAPADVGRALAGHPIYEDLIIDAGQTVTALQVLFRPQPDLTRIQTEITALEVQGLSGDLTDEEKDRLSELKHDEAPLRKVLTETRNGEIEAIQAIVANYADDTNIYLGGVHLLGYQLIQIVRSDLVVFGAAIAGIVALLLLLLFRELRWVVIAAVCCVASIVTTIGLFGLLGLKATVISANFVALQLILTLAIVVHLIVQYREFARLNKDWDHERLIRETMTVKTPPCLYAGLTTAVGFGALLVSGFQPVISFGWMMIVAMAVSIAMALLLFPVLLAVLGGRTETDETGSVRRFLGGVATFAASRKGLIATSASLLFVLCAIGFARLDVENSFIDYFDDSTDVHRELTFIDQKLGGSTPLDIVYAVPESGEDLLLAAEPLQDLQKFDVLLSEHEAVGKILSLGNFTALARKVNGGKPVTEYEMTAAYRVMDKDIRKSLLGSFYSPDTHEVRISLRIKDTTPDLDRARLLQALQRDARAVLGDDAEFQMTNLFVLYQDILERLFRSQVLTLGVVLVALFTAFLLIFRSLRLATIALVPNILVTSTVFGVMGWLAIPLDLMTITIAAVAMGIAVDDTIHYMHRYRVEAASAEADDAIRRTHQSVGFAVLYTTIIIVAGFGSLAFSDFVPSTLFGILTGVALTAAVVFDLTVLPVLLARYARIR